MNNQVVAVHVDAIAYPTLPPFHPDRAYPEYRWSSISGESNTVYEAVRRCLYHAGLDRERFESPEWNPFHGLVRPGDFVLLKPNLVKEAHPRDPDGWKYVLTHGSIIRAVLDYVFIALKGRGRVMVADGPQTDSSFSAIVERLGLNEIEEFYRRVGFNLEITDLRKEQWRAVDEVIVERRALSGDPNGYVAFDLGENSEFSGHGGQNRYYGADYDAGEVNRHHSGGRHEYLVSGSAVRCDVLINLPKLKTHKKTGITVNLKNLVGVNGDKNWLPHHTVGYPGNGGDQYPDSRIDRRLEHTIASYLRWASLRFPLLGTWANRKTRPLGKRLLGDGEEVIRSGNWYGNDTAWRMCLDLNKIVLYGQPDGTLRMNDPRSRKRYLSFVDGIIGGEGSGPMNPDPRHTGVLLFGADPARVDAAAAVIMGFDPRKIPIVRQAFLCRGFEVSDGDWQRTVIKGNRDKWVGSLGDIFSRANDVPYRPHFGWKGHIENNSEAPVDC